MEVEFHFQPDDGPLQVLYATMPRDEFEAVKAVIADPDADSIVFNYRSAKDGDPLGKMGVFRAWRISEFKEAE